MGLQQLHHVSTRSAVLRIIGNVQRGKMSLADPTSIPHPILGEFFLKFRCQQRTSGHRQLQLNRLEGKSFDSCRALCRPGVTPGPYGSTFLAQCIPPTHTHISNKSESKRFSGDVILHRYVCCNIICCTAVQTAATLTKCSHIIIPAVTTGVSHTHNHVKSQTGCFCKNFSATVPDKAGLICIVSMSAGADKTSVNTVIYIYARVYKYSQAQYCEKKTPTFQFHNAFVYCTDMLFSRFKHRQANTEQGLCREQDVEMTRESEIGGSHGHMILLSKIFFKNMVQPLSC